MTVKLHKRLLMTGAAGGLGRAMRTRLQANCAVLRLSDLVDLGPAGEREEVMLADLADAPAVRVYGPHPRAFLGAAHITAGELIPDRLLSPAEVQSL